MGLSRLTFYDVAPSFLDDGGVLARIGAICDEFECYGYRRVGAALRHQGVVVNGKKLRRLMREHDLQRTTALDCVWLRREVCRLWRSSPAQEAAAARSGW